jgi:predicted deacylase
LSPAARLALALLACLALAGPALAAEAVERPSRRHQVYFADTPDELNVYRVYGAADGKTMMIIGGIQGNEPGGFLSADLYADITLAKGNIIVVPRANFYSIILNQRGPDGDMNRQFGDPVTARRHKKIVDVLKRLMSESDILLNLHDGSGFYRPRWEGPMANPRRYGQSLIADAGRYQRPDGTVVDLQGMAQRVLAKVNPRIENSKYHLLFNNHRTAKKDSIHKEQRLSATYYALTRCHIPAFGVETSKSLPSQAMKVRHHNLVINAFMQELGIVPESPPFHLEKPELEFLVASINGNSPVVVHKGGSLYVRAGDEVLVLHIEANYERGLTCDFLGLGSVNDLRQPFRIKKATTVVARKDHQEIGRIQVKVTSGQQPFTTVRSPILYFLVEAGGQRRVVADGEVLKVVKGDKLTLVDCLSNLPTQRDLQVNFKGFVPAGRPTNTGEDRGFEINTATDLMERYSGCQGPAAPGVECYQVVASQADRRLGAMRVEVAPARLDYLVLRHDQGPKMVYHHGEVVRAAPGERLEVVDVKTNVWRPGDLRLALDHRGRRETLDDRSIRIDPQAPAGRSRLVVLRQAMAIGHVRLKIGDAEVER